MKNIKRFLSPIAIVLVVATGSGIAVAATTSNSSLGPLVAPNDPEQSTTLSQRVDQRKNATKVRLSASQANNIAQKCVTAQTGLQQIGAKDKAAAQTRTQTYSALATQLTNTVDQLQRQNVDTASLQTVQTQFNNSINQYLSDNATYKAAMDDAVVMDCASDPTGFEATLQTARQLRAQLASDAAKVKAILPQLTQDLNNAKEALIKVNDSKR